MNTDKASSALDSQFTAQSTTAEDLLKSQTVGLVNLSDFRKRRLDVFEQKEREAQDKGSSRLGTPGGSGASTPRNGASTPQPAKKQKKQKTAGKVKLSFGLEDDESGDRSSASPAPRHGSETPDDREHEKVDRLQKDEVVKTRLGPNASIGAAPKALTKAALLREAQVRDQLRKEFLILQEAVKATEIMIPFVFYDGSNIPGGVCKVKKGDHIWLFLDRSRKVGAELGVGGADKSRREWARVGVDDLMLVRGEVIIPHHYEFYYFLVNKVQGSNGLLFNYSTEPPTNASSNISTTAESKDNALSWPGKRKDVATNEHDQQLEGANDDPSLTKVVDRRWYEKNKHIYPASIWAEYDPSKDHLTNRKVDKEGNRFFFA